ncbi:bifunctional riboflavin kinase/FAD synthetase [Subsaxibacter sp. CAU 1640]|uniref:bifunctional riboflavin kinase/FAD synthetase n=1 Tax=Subsaxibacter sp. CAU 1640 TaxID=2933271 RepID=UPI002005A164|nr:bifunctional riboflavin kinase/FAD synthetase [Subsaxibacter sp. CAU 1640]MCK7589282.1 bifunctional riboflavin kinase/FAD synthetase [Subsaxibacter sp. CAU 1640]
MQQPKTHHSKIYKSNSVVTIGTFDGVHIGHQKIIKRLTNSGKEKKLKSVVLTFFPHPRMVLQKHSDIKLLNTINERESILKDLGLDEMIVKPFTKDFANLSAHEFVKTILVEELQAKHVIIGYDHQFGKNRSADINDLKGFGKEFGFTVEEISAQDVEDVAVSSTKIRTALNQGDITVANAYLGYNYFINGIVVKGKGLGKKIGFPTANIEVIEDYKLIPKDGVYAIKSNLNDEPLLGMMNIGNNPTVGGSNKTIEVNFFDFDEDIYGKSLKIEFISRLRDEQKFESVELLQDQLKKDKLETINSLRNHG